MHGGDEFIMEASTGIEPLQAGALVFQKYLNLLRIFGTFGRLNGRTKVIVGIMYWPLQLICSIHYAIAADGIGTGVGICDKLKSRDLALSTRSVVDLSGFRFAVSCQGSE